MSQISTSSFWKKVRDRPEHLISLGGAFVNLMLLVVTGLLALYSWRQWKAVDDTLSEIKRQTPAVLLSAEAAKSSADTAQQVAASSDATTQETLRQMRRQADASTALVSANKDAIRTSALQFAEVQRPLLAISADNSPFIIIDHAGIFGVVLDVKTENKGRTPAIDSWLELGLIVDPKRGSYVPARNLAMPAIRLDPIHRV